MTPEEEPPPRFDWNRFPLLVAAAIAIGAGVYLLSNSEAPGAAEFAAFVLIWAGGVALGAFIESRKP